MNTTAGNWSISLPAETAAKPRRLGWRSLEGNWEEMRFVHFAFAPEMLAPHVPLPLDVHDGKAYVSLVIFHMTELRPRGTGGLGRWLFRGISDHPFLNLRTYVRGPAGPGIYFLAEWITNPLSVRIGPRTYGLPYRHAEFAFDRRGHGGVEHIRLRDRATGHRAGFTLPLRKPVKETARRGSIEDFLLERYTAYTHRAGATGWFDVEHAPWEFHEADWIRCDTELIEDAFPWFGAGKMIGAHLSPGVRNVRMGWPHGV
jgi:uncharacterized protein